MAEMRDLDLEMLLVRGFSFGLVPFFELPADQDSVQFIFCSLREEKRRKKKKTSTEKKQAMTSIDPVIFERESK